MNSKFDSVKSLDDQFSDYFPRIIVNIASQKLILVDADKRLEYKISTAKNGIGQSSGSGCTPLGHHVVRAKIGNNANIGAVFVGRRLTGEIYTDSLASKYPDRDWILSRILWLSGLEKGFNRLGEVDTMRRYIYIHGTPDSEPMEVPLSHGCIRMRNDDVIELFNLVSVGVRVLIIGD